jgi:hypothetical protein
MSPKVDSVTIGVVAWDGNHDEIYGHVMHLARDFSDE